MEGAHSTHKWNYCRVPGFTETLKWNSLAIYINWRYREEEIFSILLPAPKMVVRQGERWWGSASFHSSQLSPVPPRQVPQATQWPTVSQLVLTCDLHRFPPLLCHLYLTPRTQSLCSTPCNLQALEIKISFPDNTDWDVCTICLYQKDACFDNWLTLLFQASFMYFKSVFQCTHKHMCTQSHILM